ncbi:tryptophan--tRNA ligase [Asanoa siamensis]|uniref:tryptophan--tRNA ligase n=1 Tax=Asanoa siamensis TaxID=926357 RepID=A0ABQ4CLP5_9ACTN|nr:tryptophan--tRNA ligase [Asanoa siamensis]GIF72213.1 tryptophan--tRNA ligase 1 [Asanoa siamensis]
MTTNRRLTGFKPSGDLHLGNLLSAIQPMVRDQYTTDSTVFLADLHALAPGQPVPGRATVRETTLRQATVLLAAGVDPDRTLFYAQSQVPDHAELHHLLARTTSRGRTRPQAADILLHDAAEVPAGADQRQHVALTRDIASRFNRRYGSTFVLPSVVTPPVAARVLDLADPTVKMGRPASPGVIGLLDPPELVIHTIEQAMTEEDGPIGYDPAARPGVSNLLEILAACVGGAPATVGADLRGHAELRRVTAEAVLGLLRPVRARHATLARDPGYVRRLLADGAERARGRTAETVFRVKRAIGLLT